LNENLIRKKKQRIKQQRNWRIFRHQPSRNPFFGSSTTSFFKNKPPVSNKQRLRGSLICKNKQRKADSKQIDGFENIDRLRISLFPSAYFVSQTKPHSLLAG
jgi:hypothetical protein